VTLLESAAVAGAGLVAGAINTVVGSGSLITFPTLLAIGLPPVVANVTNTVGLVPGSVSGAIGYRRELRGQLARLIRLGIAGVSGGLAGGVLLLAFPSSVFEKVIPFLVLTAVVLTVLRPRLSRRVAARGGQTDREGSVLIAAVFLTAVYGGYFGAAQGVILLALLGVFLNDDLQRLNAVKNVVAALVNSTAAILFILASDVRWSVAAVEAAGAIVGGQLGAKFGRRLSPNVLRVAIVVVGLAVSVKLFLDAF
jgi:uncharacterized protein